MNVLSLFDGMSCGQIALDQLGIPVKNYFASEIDKYAIKVAQANYPDMVHLGDVKEIDPSELPKIDLLIGGSPCQGFSFAGKQLNFDDPRSQLFFEYVRLLKKLKPKCFLMENVKMKKESMAIITECLGVEPIEINSNLVSAQNRKRLYWTNIPIDSLPQDKGIMLKDILEPIDQIDDVYYYSDKSIAYMERGNEKWQQAEARRADRYTQTPDTKKAFTITANFHKGVPYNYFNDNRSFKGGNLKSYFKKHRKQLVFSKDGLCHVGDADLSGNECIKRVYHPAGKSPTLTTMGGGHREPKTYVSPDSWRKLTPRECERLQTVPEGYTDHVSNTQRYKMLGNGWTVDVIKHIFEGLKERN